jgi:rhodanese-related sulfurtransferase
MKRITLQNLKPKLQQHTSQFYLIDTREIDEYEAGHLPGALFMPWHVITEKVKGLPLGKELVLYCRTGVRAAKAAKELEKIGYTNVGLYVGGWEEWEKQL